MIELFGKALVQGYGQLVAGFATFVPNGSTLQTLVDSFGIRSITRSVAGRWVVQLSEKPLGFIPIVVCVENDATNLHEMRVESIDLVNGTFTFVHRTAAYGSLGSLALSDTVDQVQVMVLGRFPVTG